MAPLETGLGLSGYGKPTVIDYIADTTYNTSAPTSTPTLEG